MSPEREPNPQSLTLETVAANAYEITRKFGEHFPTIIAQGRGEPYFIQLPELPDTYEGRFQALRMTGFVFGAGGDIGSELQQVYFICEGWMSQAEKKEDVYPRPSQDPNRIETLIISRLHVPDQKTTMRMYEMIRDQEELVDLQLMDIGSEKPGEVRSYLLEAFVAGFQMATAD